MIVILHTQKAPTSQKNLHGRKRIEEQTDSLRAVQNTHPFPADESCRQGSGQAAKCTTKWTRASSMGHHSKINKLLPNEMEVRVDADTACVRRQERGRCLWKSRGKVPRSGEDSLRFQGCPTTPTSTPTTSSCTDVLSILTKKWWVLQKLIQHHDIGILWHAATSPSRPQQKHNYPFTIFSASVRKPGARLKRRCKVRLCPRTSGTLHWATYVQKIMHENEEGNGHA